MGVAVSSAKPDRAVVGHYPHPAVRRMPLALRSTGQSDRY